MFNIIVFFIYFIVSSISAHKGCNEKMERKGENVLHLIGSGVEVVDGGAGFEGFTCFKDVGIFKLSGCQIGTALLCKKERNRIVCADDKFDVLFDVMDEYTFNNGGEITFDGVGSAFSTIDGGDNNDWDRVNALWATEDNIIDSSGKYKNIQGRRSFRGWETTADDGKTGSIDEYHTLELRAAPRDHWKTY